VLLVLQCKQVNRSYSLFSYAPALQVGTRTCNGADLKMALHLSLLCAGVPHLAGGRLQAVGPQCAYWLPWCQPHTGLCLGSTTGSIGVVMAVAPLHYQSPDVVVVDIHDSLFAALMHEV
jgi:hypothetical protein